jgi:hypothetical protein
VAKEPELDVEGRGELGDSLTLCARAEERLTTLKVAGRGDLALPAVDAP